jgi:hypothetical protein
VTVSEIEVESNQRFVIVGVDHQKEKDMKKFKLILGAALGALCLSTAMPAKAHSVIATFTGVTNGTGAYTGFYEFNYTLQLVGGTGTFATQLKKDDYFAFVDIGTNADAGLTASLNTTLNPSWTLTTPTTTSFPPPVNGILPSDLAPLNYQFTYNSATTINNDAMLGNFVLVSAKNTGANHGYGGVDHLVSTGLQDTNLELLIAPDAGGTPFTPLPSAVSCGLGLFGLVGAGKLVRRRAQLA